ncbi:hypothetical protein [Saccharopolyspora spinosa]|nr:hypothetical protein [Saccharopolyspora spinosa]
MQKDTDSGIFERIEQGVIHPHILTTHRRRQRLPEDHRRRRY